jgi:aspartate/glutamate racemase
VIIIACLTSHAFLDDLIPATRALIIDAVAETARFCRRAAPRW